MSYAAKVVSMLVLSLCITAESFAGSNRYVILSNAEDLDVLKSQAILEGGELEETFQFHRGFATKLSGNAVEKLRAKFGMRIRIEKDVEASITLKAGGKPGGGGIGQQPPQVIPWGIAAVNSPQAISITRGAGALVCVVDTGVQADHPDLKSNVAGGRNFVINRGRVNPSEWQDDNGHGTHVSGTIAALDNGFGVVGVAPEAKIFAAKVLDRQGSGYLSAVADGVRACIANGAHVINMSLGGTSDYAPLHEAIQDAASNGIIVVVAAGNESRGVSYPAKYAEVIAVSAVDSSMAFAYFSNFGPEVAFAGPGVGVYSTVMGSAYATYSGTSMASPHVAGVAALMVASGSLGLIGTPLNGLTSQQQGQGLIDALATVLNK